MTTSERKFSTMSALESTARSVLENHPKISSAWLFGSHSRGEAGPESDVDIAVLVSAPLTSEEKIRLSAALSWELREDRVDLLVLNDAPPILCFEAISGKNLLCRDPARQAEFVSLTCRRYEDAIAMWERGLSYRREAS